MFGKNDDQVSETSKMTPEGGAQGTPGTEDATPGAIDTQHSPHEGNRDYSHVDDDRAGTHTERRDLDRDGRVHDRVDDEEAPQRLVSTTDTPEGEHGEHRRDEHLHGERTVGDRSGTDTVDGGETYRTGSH